MSKYSLKNIDPVNTSFILLTPVAAVFLTYFWIDLDGFNLGQLLLGIFFYFLSGLSITAGYHRLFSHKAYDAHPVIRLFYLVFGAAAFQNSLLKWGSDHRVHHYHVDTETDPYNINEGFFHAHMGWVMLKKNNSINERFSKDLMNDKLVQWQHKYYIPIAITAGIIFPTLVGGLLFGSMLGALAMTFARIVVLHHATFFINSLCHYLGNTPYTDTNTAKDSWFMAFLTFGEGYHNFHHYFQADYRNGIRWYHFDPTKWLINTLSWFGLAFKLRSTPQDKIMAAKMQMRAKALELKGEIKTDTDKFMLEVEKFKAQAIEAYNKLQELKNEYKALKKKASAVTLKEMKKEMKLKIEAAKTDFDESLKQWELLIHNYKMNYARI